MSELRERLVVRFYTSVSAFSADFAGVFSSVLGGSLNSDPLESKAQTNGDAQSKELSAEYKEKRKLAKRIVKAVQPSLEDATRKESEILRKPFERELQHLDHLLELSLSSRRDSLNGSLLGELSHSMVSEEKPVNLEVSSNGYLESDEQVPVDETANAVNGLGLHCDNTPSSDDPVVATVRTRGGEISVRPNSTSESKGSQAIYRTPPMEEHDTHGSKPELNPGIQIHEPPTPPISTGGDPQPLSSGGIPWYMETFDPDGTTVQEERWTGRDLVRGMSEELSDMGDEELSGLVDIDAPTGADDADGGDAVGADAVGADAAEAAKAEARRKAAAKRKRWRGYR